MCIFKNLQMTRYKQQTDVDDDTSSVGSARTEDLPTGTLTVRYHMVGFGVSLMVLL